jgi:hypothetical protein
MPKNMGGKKVCAVVINSKRLQIIFGCVQETTADE